MIILLFSSIITLCIPVFMLNFSPNKKQNENKKTEKQKTKTCSSTSEPYARSYMFKQT